MADSKKYDGSQWEHSLRKLTTATEAVENPLYSDGTAITAYALKGNEEHTGTPTPSNPVDVNGVGVRTENLLDWTLFADDYYLDINSGLPVTYTGSLSRIVTLTPIDVSNHNNVTFAFELGAKNKQFIYSLFNGTTLVRRVAGNDVGATIDTSDGDKLYICIYSTTKSVTTSNVSQAMLNTGSTPKPYEPYGYKIPISSGGVTTNIYLSEPLYKIGDYADTIAADGTVTRNIKKLVLTGAEDYDIQTVNTYGIVNFRTPVGFLSDRLPAEGMAVCTHFELQTSNISTEQSEGFRTIESNRMYLRVSNARYGTVVAFQQYLADQYSAGTPVTVWYVLETPTTETTTTSAIPTTEGANSITVDTTVQPSEFTATWTGWHDSSVKEYDGSDWQ